MFPGQSQEGVVVLVPGGGLPGYLDRCAVYPHANRLSVGQTPEDGLSALGRDVVRCVFDVANGRRSKTVLGVVMRNDQIPLPEIAGAMVRDPEEIANVVEMFRAVGVFTITYDPNGDTLYSLPKVQSKSLGL